MKKTLRNITLVALAAATTASAVAQSSILRSRIDLSSRVVYNEDTVVAPLVPASAGSTAAATSAATTTAAAGTTAASSATAYTASQASYAPSSTAAVSYTAAPAYTAAVPATTYTATQSAYSYSPVNDSAYALAHSESARAAAYAAQTEQAARAAAEAAAKPIDLSEYGVVPFVYTYEQAGEGKASATRMAEEARQMLAEIAAIRGGAAPATTAPAATSAPASDTYVVAPAKAQRGKKGAATVATTTAPATSAPAATAAPTTYAPTYSAAPATTATAAPTAATSAEAARIAEYERREAQYRAMVAQREAEAIAAAERRAVEEAEYKALVEAEKAAKAEAKAAEKAAKAEAKGSKSAASEKPAKEAKGSTKQTATAAPAQTTAATAPVAEQAVAVEKQKKVVERPNLIAVGYQGASQFDANAFSLMYAKVRVVGGYVRGAIGNSYNYMDTVPSMADENPSTKSLYASLGGGVMFRIAGFIMPYVGVSGISHKFGYEYALENTSTSSTTTTTEYTRSPLTRFTIAPEVGLNIRMGRININGSVGYIPATSTVKYELPAAFMYNAGLGLSF
ncbi:MAG: hypothetical protein R3Y70_03050 [Rikenellaceae bacterium]